MLAGATRSSTFSPASTWPLAASSSTQELDCLGSGAAGIGRLSLSAAGVGDGLGAGVCAMARPTAEVNRAASSALRTVRVAFIDNTTPGVEPLGASEVERKRWLVAHELRLAEAQPGDTRRQLGDVRAVDRADAHAPDLLAGGYRIEQARAGDAGAAQHRQCAFGVGARAEGGDLQGHAAGDCRRRNRGDDAGIGVARGGDGFRCRWWNARGR